MKIVLINGSGNVGKSTIAREVFGVYPIMEFETHNAGNSNVSKHFPLYLKSKSVEDLYQFLVTNDDAVVDVGSSNVMEFLKTIAQYEGLADLIDRWVIPTTPKSKEMTDTIKTVSILIDLGIDEKKIYVIGNMGKYEDFTPIQNAAKKMGFHFDENLVIDAYQAIDDAYMLGIPLWKVSEEEIDYVEKIKNAKTPQEAKKWIKQSLTAMSGKRAITQFRKVFTRVLS